MTEDGRGPSDLPSNDSLLRAVAVAPPRSTEHLEDPARIANFRIVARLGSGGMGVVYQAEDESLRRHVALKLPHASHTNDPERRRRFLREARAAAALTHPNVAAVYQVGETDTWVYIAMEFVDGATLRERLKDGPLPGSAARALALQMARGLAAAHAKGIVHRDFKPENIMVTTAGVVKVLDFGLAKGGSAVESDSALGNAETETQITRDGTLLGTSAYMSPEQALGMTVDARSDVFAFGIVLFEMLAGRRPFEGRTAGELRAAITRDQPASISELAGAVDVGLENVVARCLAKAPAERFPDAQAIAAALESGDEHVVARSTPARRMPHGARWLLASIVGAAIAAAFVLVPSWRRSHQVVPSPVPGLTTAPGWECASDHECARGRGAGPWHCNQRRHACVEIPSVDCRVSSEPADLARDDIIWFGGLFPLSTEPDMDSEMHAAELARQEFAQALGSSGERRGEMRARPIGLVVCDEGSDAARAARHLAEDVEVPAVIGFRSAKSALATIPPILLPNRVLSFLTITEAADVTSIPEPKGEPRLIWRSTLSATAQRAPTSALISEVLEPLARSRPGGLGDRPMRVAVVRRAAPHVVADADFRALRFNGKSALDNGDNFQQFVAEPIDAGFDEVVDALLDFGPEVVYPRVDDGFVSRVVVPLEKRWRHGPRPFYIMGPVFEPALLDFIGKDSERRRRFFGLTNVSTAVNSELVFRYNVAFPREPVTPTTAPQPSYDAFYVLAYAAIALGDSSVNGPDLSRAMSRLLPPGHPVDVGPAGIFDAFETLRSGRRIDLEGALGSLDFDPATGEEPVDYAILCCGVDAHGRASGSIESGLVYDTRRGLLTGTMHCP